MTDFEKFKEELPSKEKFNSLLTGKKISDKEYEHDLKIWKEFKMKMMKDYHNLYLKCSVLLLADAFEKFRNKELWTMSTSLFECTSLNLGCDA